MNLLTCGAIFASVAGNVQAGFACLGAAIGVGMVGACAVEAVGKNPSKFGKIMIIGVLAMALSEAVAFYGLFL